MTKSPHETDAHSRAQVLLDAGAAAELRLLKQERKAERRLAAALASLENDQRRLLRTQERVERSLTAVADAEAALRDCQKRRAVGPPSAED